MNNGHSSPLKSYRERFNPALTQAALAELIGVDRVTVSRWESGSRKIDESFIPIVAEKTGIPAAVLRPDLAALFAEPAA